MLICESFLLVKLEKSKHRKSIALGSEAIACLAGAGIMDLILGGKLILEEKRLKLLDTDPTGVDFLDKILTIIKESKKIRKLKRWIIEFSSKGCLDLDNLVFISLENQGILQFEMRVTARIFYKWIYNFTKPEIIQSLLERIQNAFIDDNVDPEIALLCLYPLIQINRLFGFCFSKEYRNMVKYRNEQLLLFGNYDPSHIEMIKSVKKAIKSVLSAADAFYLP
ncbi:MAG: GPP34 family phosphoprotein [Promethearchaeota archaeon]